MNLKINKFSGKQKINYQLKEDELKEKSFK